MMIRQKPYKVGSRVRVHHVHGGYRLPEGLPNRARVRVLTLDVGSVEVEYRGRAFRVAMACIDSGWLPVIPQSPHAHRHF
jgi:hypothetical protein